MGGADQLRGAAELGARSGPCHLGVRLAALHQGAREGVVTGAQVHRLRLSGQR